MNGWCGWRFISCFHLSKAAPGTSSGPMLAAGTLANRSPSVVRLERLRSYLATPATIGIVALLLFAGAFAGMLSNHGFAATRDDSVGYILAAEHIVHGDLVFRDLAYASVRDEMGEDFAASFLSSHYVPAGESGRITSKYPVGLPAILAGARLAFGDLGYSLIGPLMGALGVAGVFLVGMELLRGSAWRWAVSLLAAFLLFISWLFFVTSIIYPMTEGAVIAASLFGFLALSLALRRSSLPLFMLAGLLFGIATLVRTSSLLLLAPASILWLWHYRAEVLSEKGPLRLGQSLSSLAAFGGAFLLAMTPVLVQNSLSTGNPFVSAQAGHLASFSLAHLFSNSGVLPGDDGGLVHYYGKLDEAVPVGIHIAMAGLMVTAILRPRAALVLFAWAVPTVLLYSAWLNPYPRYVQPALPAIVLAAAYALVMGPSLVLRVVGLVRGPSFLTLVVRWSRWPLAATVAVLAAALTLPGAVSDGVEVFDVISGKSPLIGRPATKDDTVQLRSLRSLFADQPSLLVYDGPFPISRGTVETFAGVRTITTHRYRIEDGRYYERLDSSAFARALRRIQAEGFRVYWWVSSEGAEDKPGLDSYDATLVAQFDLSYEQGVSLFAVRLGP